MPKLVVAFLYAGSGQGFSCITTRDGLHGFASPPGG